MSLKILYAASNNFNAKIVLERFLANMKNEPYIIKVAAYKKSSPQSINIDWTLDCLLNMFRPQHLSLNNDNFPIFLNQVKSFSPDLIISDLEYFSSSVASILDIPLWQCSSSLINFAMSHTQKYNLGLFKKHYYLLNKDPVDNQRFINMIDNSSYNFVYSHFADTTNPPKLGEKFNWIRPYYSLGKKSPLFSHNLVAATIRSNRKILELLEKNTDSVYFVDDSYDDYHNISMKNINNHDEYFGNLCNSKMFVCEGSVSFLADAFYNGKYSLVIPNLQDPESIINSAHSEKIGLSTTIDTSIYDINNIPDTKISINYDSSINFLHEKIKELS